MDNYTTIAPTCQYCKKILPGRKPHSKSTTGYIFCNRSCAATYNNKYVIKRKLEGKCASCDAVITKRNKYCPPCRVKLSIQQDLAKQTFGNTKNNKLTCVPSNRYANVRDHARRTFLQQNPNPSCAVCGYSKHIQVCHIKPMSHFSPETLVGEINSADNLVALCPNCHWELDHGDLNLNG